MAPPTADPSLPLLTRRRNEEEEEKGRRPWWEDTWRELRLVWYIAGPAILTSLFQFSLGSVTQTLIGHVGTLELAAVGIENLVITGIGFGVMLGMGSALETLCGQAYGAGKMSMLGIYLQRSWVILLATAVILSMTHVFATPILKLLGQSDEIAELAGRFSIWMIPELFAFAVNFPIQKFLQAQSKVMAMAWISAAVLVIHVILSWLFIVKLEMGLVGAAITLNFAWFLLDVGQLVYVLSGSCRDSWTGFSWLAFTELVDFLGLSLASAVMLCMNVEGWCFMIPLGFVAAVSVRVSNELGAGRPKAAEFSMLVVIMMSVTIQTIFMLLILLTRKDFPALFTDNKLVMDKVSKIALFLSASIFLSSIQPVLSGVAIGAGWQTRVAYINLGCYYVVGLSSGALMGFKLNLGLEGLWGGVLSGILLQTIILVVITWRTDWDKEAALALKRVSTWEGLVDVSSAGRI
ncbi:protein DETOXIFICATION 33 isoform X2 [Elaeis guineensis]|uniref:protein DETOXIFICATION 33 isoform X2 n=1 Tax=Elaeis guineensis var. tenera TaxID=51953 RepID=UPI003C6D1DA2